MTSVGIARVGVLPRIEYVECVFESEASPFGSVVTGSSCFLNTQTSSNAPDDWHVLCSNETSHGIAGRGNRVRLFLTDGFTVISRFVGARSLLQHPNVLRCQTSSPL